MMVPPTAPPLPSSSLLDPALDITADMSMAQNAQSLSAAYSQPRISIEQTTDADVVAAAVRPTLAHQLSSPPATPLSPMRHHKRTPSQHRQVKETLNAKYINDEIDGKSQHTVNQYNIWDEIGRGSYGAVHRATDQFGNEFAVKEFSKSRLRKRAQSHILRRPGPDVPHQRGPGMGPNNFHRKQFSRQEDAETKDALHLIRAEIAIMKKLNHPNLVALIEVLDDPEDDSLYMVVEMCKKGVVMKIDLDQQAEPYSSELCRTWFRDLILGIEYLHAQGIIHRDIKPDNLLLTEDDVLKIVDFGVSEMFERPDGMITKKSAGSPAFIPPELCQVGHGDVSGTAADVWSMGVTLYCLKYGKLPFNGSHALDMYKAIRETQFSLPDGEDPGFVDLITRILDKDGSTRITLHEIRNHPWVTKDGQDPLLSEEENCSDMVETPNELEMNHAFTRKMDHLICVLKAIQRFKGLISHSRATTPRATHGHRLGEELRARSPTPVSSPRPPSDSSEPIKKSVSEEAAELIAQRKAYLRSGLHLRADDPKANAKSEADASDPAEKGALFLGIGAGGDDEFSATDPSMGIVSESPTGVDFNVYDRAFETEIKRIRSVSKKNRSWTYMTKLVGEKERDKYVGDDCMIMEAGRTLANSAYTGGSSAISKAHSIIHEAREASHHHGERGEQNGSLSTQAEQGARRAMGAAKETGSRLADLVASMREMKGKGVSQGQDE